jgi:hypothetical protein
MGVHERVTRQDRHKENPENNVCRNVVEIRVHLLIAFVRSLIALLVLDLTESSRAMKLAITILSFKVIGQLRYWSKSMSITRSRLGFPLLTYPGTLFDSETWVVL